MKKNHLPERTIDEVRRFVGNGVELLMIRAIPGGRENPAFEQTFADFKAYYGEHCNDNTHAYAGIMILMKELQARGIRMGIVSNKLDSAVKELDKLYFGGLTDAAIGEKNGVRRKPAPDTVRTALGEIGVDAEHAVYVGDSDVDIQTAANAGMRCVSVVWGFRDREFLIEHGAKEIIDNPLELLGMI